MGVCLSCHLTVNCNYVNLLHIHIYIYCTLAICARLSKMPKKTKKKYKKRKKTHS